MFETAVDALVSGDVEALRVMLAADPGLVRERSSRPHRSTLLHYVGANGVEQERQRTPANIVEIAALLLDAGAEIDAEQDSYGGGCTTLGLVATSVHPERAGVQLALLQLLLDRGARLDHRSAAGNGHTVVHGCIANGQPKAGRYLAERGAPLDLETAAALGFLDYLREALAGERPRQSQLDSAFLYACGYGCLEAAQLLLDFVDPAKCADAQGWTALDWAHWTPQPHIIEFLLRLGATRKAV